MRAIEISSLHSKSFIAVILLAIAFVAMTWTVYTFLPVHKDANPPMEWGFSVDWKNNIREASLRLISGQTPYTQPNNCFPPWLYLLVAPVAVLPPAIGAAVMFVLTYGFYVLILFRLKATPLVILSFIFNRFSLHNAWVGNVDFLAALGFVLPPEIGLFFVLAKPQIGAGIAIFWMVEAWRTGRFRGVVRLMAPVTIAYLISFVLYGFWPIRLVGMPGDDFNAGLWPWGIPIFIVLMYKAISSRDKFYSMGAAPFLAPYTNLSSYVVALFPFIPHDFLFILAVAVSWI
jgi:hypothetical protein